MRLMRLAKQLTLSWVANAVVLAVVTAVLSGVTVDTVGDLIRAALLFGILNTIVKTFLRLLTLPLAFITLGLIWFGLREWYFFRSIPKTTLKACTAVLAGSALAVLMGMIPDPGLLSVTDCA